MDRFILGIIFSTLISIIAYKKESLSLSGAIAAIIMGTSLFGFGGIIPSILMVMFFISSSILSKINSDKKKTTEAVNNKGSRRDYMQVIANGGVAVILSIVYYFTNDFLVLTGIAVSFAVANADTWASEIGTLSKSSPVSILTFKKVQSGMSGGISLIGTIASLGGAMFIAIIFTGITIIKYGVYIEILYTSTLIVVLGFMGSIIDSILGATVQVKYYNKNTKTYSEKKYTQGNENEKIKGIGFIDNDMVNILSNLITTLIIFIF